MNLYYLKKQNIYLPAAWPNEIGGSGVLKYFIYGQGWKKSKEFSVIPGNDLPDIYDKKNDWLTVAKIFDKYGIEVAADYAERLTCGVMARQSARSCGYIYQNIKHLFVEGKDINKQFFNCLSCDYTLACFGMFLFDVCATDENFSKVDPLYDSANCTYNGLTNFSMKDYVNHKWGSLYVKAIEELIHIK